MRRSVGDRLRAAVRAVVLDRGAAATPAKLEQRLREGDPPLYAEWRRTTPESSARLAYLGSLLGTERARRPVTGRPDTELFLWPIGPRQRWHLLAARGTVVGSAPDSTEIGFYLHNYGTSDAIELLVSLAGLSPEFVPRISARETVEVEWSEERIHPRDAGLPPSEARGYPDPFNPSGDRQESRCELRVEFVANGRRRLLEGDLYFWGGSPPTFFQQVGPSEAPDRAGPVR